MKSEKKKYQKFIEEAKRLMKSKIKNKYIKFIDNLKYIETSELPDWYKRKLHEIYGTVPPAFYDYKNKIVVMNPSFYSRRGFIAELLHELSHAFDDIYKISKEVNLPVELKNKKGYSIIRPELYDAREWIAIKISHFILSKTKEWNKDEKKEFKRVMVKYLRVK